MMIDFPSPTAESQRPAESQVAIQPAGVVPWMLIGASREKTESPTVFLHSFPFSIGRRAGSTLQLNHRTVSSQHAEIHLDDQRLIVTDLGSTNGTFVNGKRIQSPTELIPGDLLQFAEVAFRVQIDQRNNTSLTIAEDVCDQALALVQFDRLMENRLVSPDFQPIVHLPTGSTIGYEVLGRSRLFGLESSAAMFSAAARLNMEVELSRMLRWEGVREGLGLPKPCMLFVNTHPLELEKPGLVESMVQVRQLSQEIPIILEIHEAAVTDAKQMVSLRNELRKLNIGLAYDDFGAGQARLNELTAAPPDYLKFDMSLIRSIDSAGPERQRFVATLVSIAKDLGIITLAEGIETVEEAEICRQIGFTTAQGFFYGRPSTVRSFSGAAGPTLL